MQGIWAFILLDQLQIKVNLLFFWSKVEFGPEVLAQLLLSYLCFASRIRLSLGQQSTSSLILTGV
jgi:hypothetical protein